MQQGSMGNQQLGYYAGQAYQADLVPDKDELVIRMNIVSIIRSVGAALGVFVCPFRMLYIDGQAHTSPRCGRCPLVW